jgi:hypothetical protein
MTEQFIINDKEVNVNSLEVDGVDSLDYPDFCDAYFCSGTFEDGSNMSDDELNEFSDKYGYILNEKAHESLQG